MDLINSNLKQVYIKYLLSSFGTAILPSIYGLVDMMAVGRYHGPIGSATMAIIAPIWNVIFSFGLLTGIGGAILFNIQKNTANNNKSKANEYFTVGLIITTFISIILWVSIVLFENQILNFLGADDSIIPYANSYLTPVKFTVPVYLFMQFLAGFLRNDNNPTLATKAVLIGGIFNIVGDIFFVFTLDMGIFGAGLATCIGGTLSLSLMLLHFKSSKNTIKIVRPKEIFKKINQIVTFGFSSFFVDIAMGILTILFNIQIMNYLGSDALAVFGVIVNISIFVQCCAYGVGQASQPILSANFSVGKTKRIKKLFKYNIITITILSLLWVFVTMLFPQAFVYAFMTPTQEVINLSSTIIRLYCISFLLLPFNIYCTYYFQSTMKPNISLIISISRGLIISGSLILILPIIFSNNSIWLAMPLTELIVFIYIILKMKKLKTL